ncbi:MAG TPA: hypothetical protein VEH62_13040 [Gemmatimonadales bacterium]|nr:hypothetical protein [Gemmatimonadales bacterium]
MRAWGQASRRIRRRGPAVAAALAALAWAACAPDDLQPLATDAALRRVAVAVHRDAYGRAVDLAPLLADRAVIYFFRSDCPHCAADVAAAPAVASRPGAPAVVLVSREGPSRLRAALGPAPRGRLVVVSDSDGAVMGTALPTRFVPRVVGAAGFHVRLDVTGDRGAGLAAAVDLVKGAPR